jgi:hypothetical protein
VMGVVLAGLDDAALWCQGTVSRALM